MGCGPAESEPSDPILPVFVFMMSRPNIAALTSNAAVPSPSHNLPGTHQDPGTGDDAADCAEFMDLLHRFTHHLRPGPDESRRSTPTYPSVDLDSLWVRFDSVADVARAVLFKYGPSGIKWRLVGSLSS